MTRSSGTIPTGPGRPTIGDMMALPPTLTPEQTFAIVGCSRTWGYAALRDGRLPSLSVGRRRVVPTAALLHILGIERLLPVTSGAENGHLAAASSGVADSETATRDGPDG